MEFKNPYWTNATKIQMLQQWILVHSILYYEFAESIVSDMTYDKNAAQLVKLMDKHPKSANKSRYAYVFEGYEGSTGFDLPNKLKKKHREHLKKIAKSLIK